MTKSQLMVVAETICSVLQLEPKVRAEVIRKADVIDPLADWSAQDAVALLMDLCFGDEEEGKDEYELAGSKAVRFTASTDEIVVSVAIPANRAYLVHEEFEAGVRECLELATKRIALSRGRELALASALTAAMEEIGEETPIRFETDRPNGSIWNWIEGG